MTNQEEVWDKIAPEWDNYRNVTPLVVEEFVYGKKGKILDLGCGSGRNFIPGGDLKWYGVDFSKGMIELAKDNSYKKGMEVELIKNEVYKTDFENNKFDYIICYSVLHCIETIGKRIDTLKEIFRLLRPNGEVLISVWGRKSLRLIGRDKESFVPWKLSNGRKVMRFTYLFDKKELEDLAKRIGFEIVKSNEDENIVIILRKPLINKPDHNN